MCKLIFKVCYKRKDKFIEKSLILKINKKINSKLIKIKLEDNYLIYYNYKNYLKSRISFMID